MSQTICAYLPLVAGGQPDGKKPLPLKSLDNLEDFRSSYQKTTVRVFDLDPCVRRVFAFKLVLATRLLLVKCMTTKWLSRQGDPHMWLTNKTKNLARTIFLMGLIHWYILYMLSMSVVPNLLQLQF